MSPQRITLKNWHSYIFRRNKQVRSESLGKRQVQEYQERVKNSTVNLFQKTDCHHSQFSVAVNSKQISQGKRTEELQQSSKTSNVCKDPAIDGRQIPKNREEDASATVLSVPVAMNKNGEETNPARRSCSQLESNTPNTRTLSSSPPRGTGRMRYQRRGSCTRWSFDNLAALDDANEKMNGIKRNISMPSMEMNSDKRQASIRKVASFGSTISDTISEEEEDDIFF
mmetsp:Transcript_10799/g.16058  ORF Transcript_10799/g.16058 Transcript_10799/m.16058 type:complete len:226 (+) Transcript_10799:24-701(+)